MTDMTTHGYEEIGSPLSVTTIKHQIQVIQEVMRDAMVKDTHYGVIPGTDKPTLLKAGAEKLSLTFRLSPTYVVTRLDLPNNHREYEVRCTLTHIPTQAVFGEGVGTCSSMESKYRYRNVADFELTGEPIPKDSKEKKKEYRAQGFGMKKVNGTWEWVKYKDTEKQEHPDIADTYNTILKMAKKRAHVDAVLTATAASDIFAQDLEDLPNAPHVDRADSQEFEYAGSTTQYRNTGPHSPRAPQVVVSQEIQNSVHDATLLALEDNDQARMAEIWKKHDADTQVVLFNMFNSQQRNAIKKLMRGK
jgi:uncharacterized protein (UPF0335 family)